MSIDNITHKKNFLNKAFDKKEFTSHPLPNDASARKYERIVSTEGKYMLMDASLEKHSVPPFVSIAEFLNKKGYSTPKIFHKEEEKGYLLLEDLGETSYASVLNSAAQEEFEDTERKLYKRAIDLLVDMHHNVAPHEIELPSYNKELLLREAMLLVEWYMPTLNGLEVSEELRNEYAQAWDKVFDCIHYTDACLVLRDYHIDNLIWMEERLGLKRVGLLDFQDAVKGSYAYDVVSLLEDARRDVSPAIMQEMLEHYISKRADLDRKKILSDYKVLGVQRACKIIGIFARKAARDNDSRYLKHLPRVWRSIKRNIDHPILEPIRIWFDKMEISVMNNSEI